MKNKPLDILIVGAGNRGMRYAQIAERFPDKLRVAAVAEPRQWYREKIVRQFGLPPEKVFLRWQDVLNAPKCADAAIIATPDRLHAEPAVAFARNGYHLVIEKPLAEDEAGCRKIVEAVEHHRITAAICHILRYTPYAQEIHKLLRSGTLGELVSLQHTVPVGYFHQVHSFVRGNWRNSQESSSMLLQKGCHDLDLIRYWVGKPCRKISSFGGLFHFRAENAPQGAADRCLKCPPGVENACPYSAERIYFKACNEDNDGLTGILTPEPTPERVEKALREGPYGRCVYACDNDVTDHQCVSLEFEGGATASFLMSGFSPGGNRRTLIHGTRGMIEGNGNDIRITDFLTGNVRTVRPPENMEPDVSNVRLLLNFAEAVRSGNPNMIIAPVTESLKSFRCVFAAERARLTQTIQKLSSE